MQAPASICAVRATTHWGEFRRQRRFGENSASTLAKAMRALATPNQDFARGESGSPWTMMAEALLFLPRRKLVGFHESEVTRLRPIGRGKSHLAGSGHRQQFTLQVFSDSGGGKGHGLWASHTLT